MKRVFPFSKPLLLFLFLFGLPFFIAGCSCGGDDDDNNDADDDVVDDDTADDDTGDDDTADDDTTDDDTTDDDTADDDTADDDTGDDDTGDDDTAETGACCMADHSCQDDMTDGECDAAGGVWQGADTLCTDVVC